MLESGSLRHLDTVFHQLLVVLDGGDLDLAGHTHVGHAGGDRPGCPISASGHHRDRLRGRRRLLGHALLLFHQSHLLFVFTLNLSLDPGLLLLLHDLLLGLLLDRCLFLNGSLDDNKNLKCQFRLESRIKSHPVSRVHVFGMDSIRSTICHLDLLNNLLLFMMLLNGLSFEALLLDDLLMMLHNLLLLLLFLLLDLLLLSLVVACNAMSYRNANAKILPNQNGALFLELQLQHFLNSCYKLTLLKIRPSHFYNVRRITMHILDVNAVN